MTKRMLIDATHAEETRVAVVDGNTLSEFDYESKFRKPLKGSIFLAKVTRVEPSLQAAFVNFGGNRHGFLPFSEIHPDYFRIPIADREALLAEQEELLKKAEEEQEKAEDEEEAAKIQEDDQASEDTEEKPKPASKSKAKGRGKNKANQKKDDNTDEENELESPEDIAESEEETEEEQTKTGRGRGRRGGRKRYGRNRHRRAAHNSQKVEILGGTEYEEDETSLAERARFAWRKKYKIQEVIKRGQIMLVQISREERGNKGAAVSTYLSLPGRYGVLMPNSPRSGGISRKIANYKDRSRLRKILKELDTPQGMSVILRTAGISRTKTEIKRDTDYLKRLWDDIRELTLNSSAPALIYEEADLVKRAIRDIYTRDIEEIIVAGEKGHKATKKFMKIMIPSHASRVKLYKDEDIPLFHRYQVESQISEIGEPTATLKSGGYLVINPTEALVSIDVNSGRATKERHIEETALNTNVEAAEEVARQLRLRDLGGLIVVDFIDMEDRRNNARVEKKLKEALSNDRARIQIGRISTFGLLEMSRQRLNPSLTEAQFETCPSCNGIGNIRTVDATTITLLRAIEEEGIKKRAAELIVHVSNRVAMYMLNYKRGHLEDIENRYGLKILIRVEDDIGADKFRIEVSKPSEQHAQSRESRSQEEEPESEENEQKSAKGRRRGRRGGRGRRRSVKDTDTGNHETEENKSTQKGKDKNISDQKETSDSTDDIKEVKPKGKTASKIKKDVEETSKKTGGEEKTNKASSRKESAPKPSNDAGFLNEKSTKSNEEEEHKVYETVNEAPEKPKKGWWNKLMD